MARVRGAWGSDCAGIQTLVADIHACVPLGALPTYFRSNHRTWNCSVRTISLLLTLLVSGDIRTIEDGFAVRRLHSGNAYRYFENANLGCETASDYW